MRREGFELTIGQPQVLVKEINDKKHEPFLKYWWWMCRGFQREGIDMVTSAGEKCWSWKARVKMQHLEFEIPSRGLIGLRSNMLTNTAG